MSRRTPTGDSSVIDLTEEDQQPLRTSRIPANSSASPSPSDVAILRTIHQPSSEVVPLISSPAPPSRLRKLPFASLRANDEVAVLKVTKVARRLKAHQEVHLIPSEPTTTLTHTPSPAPVPESVPAASKRCPICFDALQNPSVTLCGHVYCRECITTVARSTKQCPICRKKLTNKGFHPLFL